jgi:hypothetical protein
VHYFSLLSSRLTAIKFWNNEQDDFYVLFSCQNLSKINCHGNLLNVLRTHKQPFCGISNEFLSLCKKEKEKWQIKKKVEKLLTPKKNKEKQN